MGWDLYHKEGWVPKNGWFWTVALEKTLEISLESKKIKPVNSKGNQPWIFIGKTDVETEAPIIQPPDTNSWLIRKDLDAGKDWRQEDNGATEDEMVGWHHRLHGHEFEQTLGDSEGQGSLACCSSWGHKKSNTTWWVNNEQQHIIIPSESFTNHLPSSQNAVQEQNTRLPVRVMDG